MANLNKLGALATTDENSCRANAAHFGTRYPADAYPDFFLMVVEATRGGKFKLWRLLDTAVPMECLP